MKTPNKHKNTPEDAVISCLNINCPERTGGKCNVLERKGRRKNENWEETFNLFFDSNETGGSSRWLVTPDTVRNFIKGLLK